ncbi:MAG TPA: CHAD domain-containing protein [Lacipirellulaceae bacterium]|jgi:CHAD domain-containing protein
MSFALRDDESVRKGVKRTVRKEFKDALDLLTYSENESVDERVHSVRKSFKRVRAIVRLVRYSLEDSEYRFENEIFRDASRPHSEIRDAKIWLETLDKLRKSSDGHPKLAFRTASRFLVEQQKQLRKKVLKDQHGLERTSDVLKAAIQRVNDWDGISNKWQELALGIGQVYRQGRKAAKQVKLDPSVANLHEWRKQIKYLRHQLELLTPIEPTIVGTLAGHAESVGDLLGEDHDLAVLREKLSAEVAGERIARHMTVLGPLIDDERQSIQVEAIPKGKMLFRDNPKKFVNRLKNFWREWAESA